MRVDRDLQRVITRAAAQRRLALEHRRVDECRRHGHQARARRVVLGATELAPVRQASVEARAVHRHVRVARDGTARRAEGRHARGRVVREVRAGRAELLAVQSHLHVDRVVLHERVRLDDHLAEHVLIDGGARASPKAELPVRLRRPLRKRQVVDALLAVVHDVQTARALRHHHLRPSARVPRSALRRLDLEQRSGHRCHQRLVVPHLDALLQTRQQRHAQASPHAQLAKLVVVRQRTEHEADALRAAVALHAGVAALITAHVHPERRTELANRPDVVKHRHHHRAGLAALHQPRRQQQQRRAAGVLNRRAAKEHRAHVLAVDRVAAHDHVRPGDTQPARRARLSRRRRDAQKAPASHRLRGHERVAKPLERRAVVRGVHPRLAKLALSVGHVGAQVLAAHQQARLAVEDARRRLDAEHRGRLVEPVRGVARRVLLRIQRHLERHLAHQVRGGHAEQGAEAALDVHARRHHRRAEAAPVVVEPGVQILAVQAHRRVARHWTRGGSDQPDRRRSVPREVDAGRRVLLRVERHLERGRPSRAARHGRAMQRRVGLVKARVHRHSVEAAHVVRPRTQVVAQDPHDRRARLRAALREERRDRRRRLVHQLHRTARELLPVGRHLDRHRPRLVLRASHQKQVVDAVLVVHLGAGTHADAEAPARLRRPRAQDQLIHEPRVAQLHAQTRKAERDQHRHEALLPHQRHIQRPTQHQHVPEVHLEPRRTSAQQHAKAVARALLAKRHLGQIAKAHAHALAAVATAALDPQIESQLKVALQLPQRRQLHDHRALVARLRLRHHKVALAHHVVTRRKREQSRVALERRRRAEVERQPRRRVRDRRRQRDAPVLAGARPLRRHRVVLRAEHAQPLLERLQIGARHAHQSVARRRAARGAQARHRLRSVVHELHVAAAELLPVHRHLDAHRPRALLRRRRARQVAEGVVHRTDLERAKLAPVVRATRPGRTSDGHKRLTILRSADRLQLVDCRVLIHGEEQPVVSVEDVVDADLERDRPRSVGWQCATQRRLVLGLVEGGWHDGCVEAAGVREARLQVDAAHVHARVT